MTNTLHRFVATGLIGAAVMTVVACGAGELRLPPPRRLVIYSGARLAPTQERMEEVDDWVRAQWDSITLDPSFMINTLPQEGPIYPWGNFELNQQGDTATIAYRATSPRQPFLIYAHLHLMAAQNRLARWLPEAADEDGFELERAILTRTADSWLYQRAINDAPPDAILDELMFVAENDYLDAFLLTARPNEFVEARREWLAANPDGADAFVEWFRETFERDPPGLRSGGRGG